MATQVIASIGGDLVRLEVDYNAGNRKVTTVRCVNNSDRDAMATLLKGVTIVAQVRFTAGQTWEQAIAGNHIMEQDGSSLAVPFDLSFYLV